MKLKPSSLLSTTALIVIGSIAACSSNSGGASTSGSGGSATGGSGTGGTGKGGASGTGGDRGVGGSSAASASGGSGGASQSGTGGKVGAGGSAQGGSAGSSSSSTSSSGGGAGNGDGGVTGKGGGGATGGQSGLGGGNGPDAGGDGSAGKAGSGGAGGSTAVTVGASNLPAVGAGGVAAPSGTGSTVTVLDWAGYKSAVSFTFDDANQSQLDNYKALQAENDQGNNVRYTFYLITGKSQAANYGQALKDGHELANHTKSHNSAATTTDIQAAQDYLKTTYGITSYDIAAPNGDSSYQTVAPPMKEFLTNRTAGNSGGISPTDDPSTKQWVLPCIIPATGAASSAMQSSISSAISGGKWVTFLVHGFNTPSSDQSEGAYQPVSITEFTSTVSWAKTQGNIWIDTVENVSSYWIAAYHFKKLTPAAAGSDKTWTWKTSDFNTPFPTGKYLRVKTDGGTLKQGDTTLTWDEHGYYEVSLDAGTLTLSP